MKNLTPLVTTIGAKQMTVVVALIATAFVVVQASSAPRNGSANIDDHAELANPSLTGIESFSRIAADEPAVNPSSAIAPAPSSLPAAEQTMRSASNSASAVRTSGSSFSASDRSLPSAESELFASHRPTASRAPAVSGAGSASGLSSPSSAISNANGTFAGSGSAAGSGAIGGSSGSFAGNPTSESTRTDALARSIFESPPSTALANTDKSLPGAAIDGHREPAPSFNSFVGDAAFDETSAHQASSPLDFSSALADGPLDVMGMKISDSEPGLQAAISSDGDEVTPVAAVPEAGDILWLLSAAMVALMAYSQRFPFRHHAA